MIQATLLISLSCLSFYTLGSGVRRYDPGQVTGESLLLQQREYLGGWDPGPDSSKIPPRDASLGCHPLNPLPLSNLHTLREPKVPTPCPRTPPPLHSSSCDPLAFIPSSLGTASSFLLSLPISHPGPSLHTLLRVT